MMTHLPLKPLVASIGLYVLSGALCWAQGDVSKVWVADRGDGSYRNPVLNADYSDPDVIRVGGDFYLVASSFNCAPGLPILHSRDLVNWTIINHALPKQVPLEVFATPQHGNGVWAPALRYHAGEFTLYYPDPDYGIYVTKAKNPAGKWSAPVLVLAGKGIIDPCPFWDDDGKAYLVHAWAVSRAEVGSLLTINRLSADGMAVLDEGRMVFDGHERHPTVEGPKLYRRHGYYYILAPAGGVGEGWQLALRARNIYGPYEEKIVLKQGKSPTNGPHQGAWVDTPSGENWFVHFQDRGPYGRVVHLEPMAWKNDWPVMGVDADGDGCGEPVLTYRKPKIEEQVPIATPAEDDEFNGIAPGLQWQWNANPQVTWSAEIAGSGYLRLFAMREPAGNVNLWKVPNLLLQKFPATAFTVTTKLRLTAQKVGSRAGLLVMGYDYAALELRKEAAGYSLAQVICEKADKDGTEQRSEPVKIDGNWLYLRVTVSEGARCEFSYSVDDQDYRALGKEFTAREGRWIGARVGVYCTNQSADRGGYADFDWFRITANAK